MTKGKVFASPARRDDKLRTLVLQAELRRRKRTRKIRAYFPETDTKWLDGSVMYRRELYKKHMQFFRMGRTTKQRLCLAGNRIGKTESMGLYELTHHLTGDYPDWWEGKRFNTPIDAWAATDSNLKVRDNLVRKLLGPYGDEGTGLIPADSLVRYVTKPGVPESYGKIVVKHISGGESTLVLKSYEEGRKSFQSEELHVILLDEEPPSDVYIECSMRLGVKGGIMMLTFTPLEGISQVTLAFFKDGDLSNPIHDAVKGVVQATWDDVPHIDKATLEEMIKDEPDHVREARRNGIPALGVGAVYPYKVSDIQFDPNVLWASTGGQPPPTWKRVYALDPGWNVTAVVWGAVDPATDKIYVYDEYYGRKGDPFHHAAVVKKRGEWIPGVIDPAAVGSTIDGKKAIEMYREEGLNVQKAINAVDTGINIVRRGFTTQTLFISKHLTEFWKEFGLYMRIEKNGKFEIKKENDHLMDAMRYLVVSGLRLAVTNPALASQAGSGYTNNHGNQGWMG